VSGPAVVALLADAAPGAALAAGFEEEGVPLVCEPGVGELVELASEAAGRSPLGLGIGGDGDRLVLVLAAAPTRAYLEAPSSKARAFAQDAARIAARRGLRGLD
jgi:hypothetical protein